LQETGFIFRSGKRTRLFVFSTAVASRVVSRQLRAVNVIGT